MHSILFHKQKFTTRHRFQDLAHTFNIEPISEYGHRIPEISRGYAAAIVSKVIDFDPEYGATIFQRNTGDTTHFLTEGITTSLIHYNHKNPQTQQKKISKI
jgi:hypothetical protein